MAITGTRRTDHRSSTWFSDLFAKYLGPWATPGAEFHIGGARGIDTLSLLWLAENSQSRLTIVTPGTVAQQPAEARQAIERCRGRISEIIELGAVELGAPAYHARNRYMVDRAQMVIGFPLEGPAGSSGSWQTIDYAASEGKPRLIVPV
ncbi:hypothetical protein ACWC10_08345 [Streptomyces sp. NPDC001595]|uniref:hypothetical protein n=1 Tax=Streptomyces sp. NPDC001532 TaxID=3154520 RepID=UPI003316C639